MIYGIPVTRFVRELYKEISEDDIFNGAAALGYYLTLALFPAIIFVMAVIPYLPIADVDVAIMDLLRQVMPASAADMVSGSSRLLENNIDRLANISGQTLTQVGGIVGRFDEHSKVLAQASELLGAAQSNLANTLDERQTALAVLLDAHERGVAQDAERRAALHPGGRIIQADVGLISSAPE